MSENESTVSGDAAADSLQFDQAEFQAGGVAASHCAVCKTGIVHEYFQTNGQIICPPCRQGIETQLTSGSASGRWLKALVMGAGAGAVGWAIYYAVLKFLNIEFGLISILVGYMVGFAVNKGANGRGGWAYQTMAILITYFSIVASYIPLILENTEVSSPIAIVILAVALPFLQGLENVIGLLIIFFGLYQAWRMNRKVKIEITGPFTIAGQSVPAPAP